jgi:hypothetical protein
MIEPSGPEVIPGSFSQEGRAGQGLQQLLGIGQTSGKDLICFRKDIMKSFVVSKFK